MADFFDPEARDKIFPSSIGKSEYPLSEDEWLEQLNTLAGRIYPKIKLKEMAKQIAKAIKAQEEN